MASADAQGEERLALLTVSAIAAGTAIGLLTDDPRLLLVRGSARVVMAHVLPVDIVPLLGDLLLVPWSSWCRCARPTAGDT